MEELLILQEEDYKRNKNGYDSIVSIFESPKKEKSEKIDKQKEKYGKKSQPQLSS